MHLIFSKEKDRRLYRFLLIMTFMDVFLVLYRNFWVEVHYMSIQTTKAFEALQANQTMNFFFLVWNLFLAWVPFLIANNLYRLNKRDSPKWLIVFCIVVWLLFFPNAPYIITDFVHLKFRYPIPKWYDTLMLLSFTFTSMLLGLLSLVKVQKFLQDKIGLYRAWLMSIFFIALSSFGVYLGRFRRWNSWDIVTQPEQLFLDIFATFQQPIPLFTFTFVFFMFFSFCYVLFYWMLNQPRHEQQPLSN